MIDKQIHRNEFKLRLLLTNQCNMSCNFCLNDFQVKGRDFLDFGLVQRAIRSYMRTIQSCEGMQYTPQLYLSGGEPTLHPDFVEIMGFARATGMHITVCTNGSNDDVGVDWALRQADRIHIGAYRASDKLAETATRLKNRSNAKVSIQCVYSEADPYVDLDFLEFYLDRNLPVKVFADFNERGVARYLDFLDRARDRFKGSNLQFRHTGVQENRGLGCEGCERKCITLKAAWVFPDGSITPCPQGELPSTTPLTPLEWEKAMVFAEMSHRAL